MNLDDVARAETAAVYSNRCPEYSRVRAIGNGRPQPEAEVTIRRLIKEMTTTVDAAHLADEAKHLKAMGLSVLEIADRLDTTVAAVRKAVA